MNMMAEPPGVAFQFSMEADDSMEISSPHMAHDQDIDIDLELGDGEELAGEDENMLEDAPVNELSGMMDQAEPALVDDEMAEYAPTPRPEIQTSFGFAPSDFNPEANDLDLIDDGEDYPFAGYPEVDVPQEAEFMGEQVHQDNSLQELPLASDANNTDNGQLSHGDIIASGNRAEESVSLNKPENTHTLQPLESGLSLGQSGVRSSVASEQFPTVPTQASMNHADISTPKPIAGETQVVHDSLDSTFVLPDKSKIRDLDSPVAQVEQQKPHPEPREAHYPPEGEPDEDGSSEDADVVSSLHPVVVKYQSEEMSLFQSKESEVEHSPTFLLQDQALASQSILELLNACRDVLAGSVDGSEELSLRMDDLGLDFCENTPESSTTSLSEVLDIYLQLCFNDGTDFPEPLSTVLCTKPRLAQRLELLRTTASDGGSLSSVAYTTNDREAAYEEEDDHQSAQDTVDQLLQEQEPAQSTTDAAKDNVVPDHKKDPDVYRRSERKLESKPNDLESQHGHALGTENSANHVHETEKAAQTTRLLSGSLVSHKMNPQDAYDEKIKRNGGSSPAKGAEMFDQQLAETNHQDTSEAHGLKDSASRKLEDLENGGIEHDFELNFDQTAATTDVPFDEPAQLPQDATTKNVAGPDYPADLEPHTGSERRRSSSKSSTIKGETDSAGAFGPVELTKLISEELEAEPVIYNSEEPNLDVANAVSLLEDKENDDEVSWEEDEDLPSHTFPENDHVSLPPAIADVQNIDALKGKDIAQQTSAPEAELNGASSSTGFDYDSDEITYEDEELDAPLPVVEKVVTPKISQSPKDSPGSIKRSRTSDGELDNDRLDGQGAKRVKSM